jgi:hypothetical protein
VEDVPAAAREVTVVAILVVAEVADDGKNSY